MPCWPPQGRAPATTLEIGKEAVILKCKRLLLEGFALSFHKNRDEGHSHGTVGFRLFEFGNTAIRSGDGTGFFRLDQSAGARPGASPAIEEPVKRRLKQNVRRSFGQRSGAAPATREPSTGPPPTAADDLVKVVVPARDCADTERLIRGAAGSDEYGADEYVVEARRIADQLRHCLSQHTETAQKVSAYLRALLVLSHGHYRPKMVIEI